MDIRFIRIHYHDEEGRYISFWSGKEIRYDFEITYEDNENVELFENELKLNLENQLDLKIQDR